MGCGSSKNMEEIDLKNQKFNKKENLKKLFTKSQIPTNLNIIKKTKTFKTEEEIQQKQQKAIFRDLISKKEVEPIKEFLENNKNLNPNSILSKNRKMEWFALCISL